MHRFITLILLLGLVGCASNCVEHDVSQVLDDWSDPPGVLAQNLDVQAEQQLPYDDMVSSFPLPWPDLAALREVSQLVEHYGEEPVLSALENEYHQSSLPRNLRALCLIYSIGESDRWLQLWNASNQRLQLTGHARDLQ